MVQVFNALKSGLASACIMPRVVGDTDKTGQDGSGLGLSCTPCAEGSGVKPAKTGEQKMYTKLCKNRFTNRKDPDKMKTKKVPILFE